LGSRLKEGSREEIARREAELDFNAEELEAEIAGYEAEIREEFKGDLIGYREGLAETAKTAAAGKDVNSKEFKKFREGLMKQIFELRQFEEWRGKLKEGQLGALEKMALLQEKMSVDTRRSLRLMSEAVLNLQRIRAQEGAVRELKQMTDKLYYSIFKKVSSDVDLAYADAIENVQAVLGSKSLAKYLGNLHSSGLSLETFAADYIENAEYRGKIDAVLDESARVRLRELLYDGDGKPRPGRPVKTGKIHPPGLRGDVSCILGKSPGRVLRLPPRRIKTGQEALGRIRRPRQALN
ncbi:MAG: hypothetical protein LBG90_05600, partial [Spirochaetaceae bacterium]|jgi:hypothetical protein|nr:hypothetical protein [Spirochaetaceae bacterium]